MTADDVKRILVVGAGQMGAQIAMQSALHGYQITLNDLNMDVLQQGHGREPQAARAPRPEGADDQGQDGRGHCPRHARARSREGRARRRFRHRGHRGAARAQEGLLRQARPFLPAPHDPGDQLVHAHELSDRALDQAAREVRQHALLLPAAGHEARRGGQGAVDQRRDRGDHGRGDAGGAAGSR